MPQTGEIKWKYEQGNLDNLGELLLVILKGKIIYHFQRLFLHTEKEQMKSLLGVSPRVTESQLYEPSHCDVLHSWSVAPYCTAGQVPKMKNVYFAVYNSCRGGRQRFQKEIQASK